MTTTETLIPLHELTEVLTDLMRGREYLAREPFLRRRGDETGWEPAPLPLPPDQGLRLSDFEDAITHLPDPCPEQQAAEAILAVFRQRGPGSFLGKELTDLCEQKWPGPEAVPASDESPAAAVSVLKCAWCSAPIPLARGPQARFCKNSHRINAHRAKKREQERANAGTPPSR